MSEPAGRSLARRFFWAFALLYALFAWPIADPLTGRQLAMAEAFSHGRIRAQGEELLLPGGGDFAFPDGPEGGGVPIFGIGSSWVAAPLCFVIQAALEPAAPAPERRRRVVFLECCAFLALIVLAGAGTVSLLGQALAALDLPRPWATAALYGLSIPFAMTTTVTPHVPAVLCGAGGLYLLSIPGRPRGASFAAGLAIGAGVLCDLSFIAPAAIPLGVYALVTGDRRSNKDFVLGAVAPAVAFGIWNTLSFGAPWRPAPRVEDMPLGGVRYDMGRGYWGLLSPGNLRGRVLFEVLFGQRSGLFCFVPVLLLGFSGIPALWRRHRALAVTVAVGASLGVLQIAVKEFGWMGGNSVGPRYMLPVIFLLFVPLTSSLERWPRTTLALGGLSVLIAWVEAQTPFYSTLSSSFADLLVFGPRLRLVLALIHHIDPTRDLEGLGRWISLPFGAGGLAGVAWLLLDGSAWRRRASIGAAALWCGLLAFSVARGTQGTTRSDIRLAELQQIVDDEEYGIRLGWYAYELLGQGRAELAQDAFVRAIELDGWKASRQSREGLREALLKLEAEGREDLVLRALQRVEAIKRRDLGG